MTVTHPVAHILITIGFPSQIEIRTIAVDDLGRGIADHLLTSIAEGLELHAAAHPDLKTPKIRRRRPKPEPPP